MDRQMAHMNIKEQSFTSAAEAHADILRFFRAQGAGYDRIVVRTVTLIESGRRSALSWLITALRPGDPDLPGTPIELPDFELTQQVLDPREFERVLDAAWRGADVAGEVPAESLVPASFSCSRMLAPVTSIVMDAPAVAWQPMGGLDATLKMPRGSRVRFDFPFIEDAGRLCKDWVRPPASRELSEIYGQPTSVILPETRAWIAGARRIDERRVEFDIRRGQGLVVPLRLKGSSAGKTFVPFDEAVGDGPVAIDLAPGAETVTALLISRDDELLDIHEEARLGAKSRWHVLRSPRGIGFADIQLRILAGENETTEFKPYVHDGKEGAKKLAEVMRTVAAFANGVGGDIYFGVTDDAFVEGLDGHFAGVSTVEEKLDAARKWVVGVRNRLKERLHPIPPMEPDAALVGERVVGILRVRPPEELAYISVDDRKVYVRRGASSREATVAELLAIAANRTRGVITLTPDVP